MLVVGLTGSIGMGKSTVANSFKSVGAAVWDADEIVHQLLGPGGSGVEPVSKRFNGIIKIDSEGRKSINRKELGKKVFENHKELHALEKILHPLLREHEKRFLMFAKFQGYRVVILDIPLLFETHGESRCDVTIVVSAPHFIQRLRVLGRNGMTSERLNSILDRQMKDIDKRRRADFVLNTGLDLSVSYRSVRILMNRLMKLRANCWPNVYMSNSKILK